jgi:hypothetical protein
MAGLSRPSTSFFLHAENVDARNKAGHDEVGVVRLPPAAVQP